MALATNLESVVSGVQEMGTLSPSSLGSPPLLSDEGRPPRSMQSSFHQAHYKIHGDLHRSTDFSCHFDHVCIDSACISIDVCIALISTIATVAVSAKMHFASLVGAYRAIHLLTLGGGRR